MIKTYKNLNTILLLILFLENAALFCTWYLLEDQSSASVGVFVAQIIILTITIYDFIMLEREEIEIVTEITFWSYIVLDILIFLHSGVVPGLLLNLVSLFIFSTIIKYQLQRNASNIAKEIFKEILLLIILLIAITLPPANAWRTNMVVSVTSVVNIILSVTYLSRSAIQKEAHFKRKSGIDALTGLPNRHMLREHLHNWEMQGLSVSCIAIVDVDKFKDFNDTYGHEVGDRVLNEVVAASLKRSLSDHRNSSFCARLGGEEFCIVFSNHLRRDTRDVLEEVRKEISSCRITTADGKTLKVTATIGGVNTSWEKIRDFDYWLKIADQNLYRGKEEGRNKVVI